MLTGFQLFTVDHYELSGKKKKKGGRICFHTSSGGCDDVTVILQHCSTDLKSFNVNLTPLFHSYTGQCSHSPAEHHAGGTAHARLPDSLC